MITFISCPVPSCLLDYRSPHPHVKGRCSVVHKTAGNNVINMSAAQWGHVQDGDQMSESVALLLLFLLAACSLLESSSATDGLVQSFDWTQPPFGSKSEEKPGWFSCVRKSNMTSQTKPCNKAAPDQQNISALLQGITLCQATLTSKMNHIQTNFGLLHRDMHKFCDWLRETECRIWDTKDSIRDNFMAVWLLQLKVKAMGSKANDAENWNRLNNLQIVELPNGSDPAAFTELNNICANLR